MKKFILAYTNTTEPYENWYQEFGVFTSLEAAIKYIKDNVHITKEVVFDDTPESITLYFKEDESSYECYFGFREIDLIC